MTADLGASSALAAAMRRGRTLRVAGFDDAPFARRAGAKVPLCGVICSATRFEGMLWGHTRRDGWGATEAIAKLLEGSKFLAQVHLVLLDGIAVGGFNVIDLPALAARLGRPCVAVMRKLPDMAGVIAAIEHLPQPARRLATLRRAGEIYQHAPFTFQVSGADPSLIADALQQLTDQGHVPEALRLAHHIGAAVRMGQSGRRA
jgi:endonuclease V-like protein UPF0215 family